MVIIHLTRVAILITLFTVGLLGIFAMPMDDSPTWCSDLFLSKVLGVACIWIFSKLYEIWRKTDKWIQAYDKWNKPQN